MDKIELRKELMRNKTVAKFHHFCHSSLYYRMTVGNIEYEFPVRVIDFDIQTATLNWASDIGTTDFAAEEPAALLVRWINRAIDEQELRVIG